MKRSEGLRCRRCRVRRLHVPRSKLPIEKTITLERMTDIAATNREDFAFVLLATDS
jgi:hypothetical protein